MEASVKTVWDGWKYLRTPDNVEVTLSFDDGESVDVFGSVLDLVDLYNHVVEREPRDVMIGTGDVVEMEFRDDRVTVVLNEQDEENLSHEGLKGTFEDLFREVFTELDAVGRRVRGSRSSSTTKRSPTSLIVSPDNGQIEVGPLSDIR